MAGVTDSRLRLTTSRKPSYRRAGVKIGSTSAPAYLGRGDATVGQLLEIVRDPNIVLAFEYEGGEVAVLSDEERAELEQGLLQVIELDGPDRTLGDNPDVYGAPLMTDEERAELEATVKARFEASAQASSTPVSEPDTAEPQGEGLTPGAEASQAGGPDATADGSDASAGDAATTEPTAQPVPPAPEPAAEPKPASKGRGKAKGSPA